MSFSAGKAIKIAQILPGMRIKFTNRETPALILDVKHISRNFFYLKNNIDITKMHCIFDGSINVRCIAYISVDFAFELDD